jgi:hypothetical protein
VQARDLGAAARPTSASNRELVAQRAGVASRISAKSGPTPSTSA